MKSNRAVGFALTIGVAGGGSSLSESTGGQDYRLRAGGGLLYSASAILPVSDTRPHRFELQAGLGFFETSTGAHDNSVRWTRIPLDLVYFYRNTREGWRLGAGMTRSLSAEIKGEGTNDSADAVPDPATGAIVEAQLMTESRRTAVGLRYTWITYSDRTFAKDVDGSGAMFTMTILTEGPEK